MKTKKDIKFILLSAGIKNLKEFGYPEVTIENILTDQVYSAFFEKMLIDNLGNGKFIDEAIRDLQTEIMEHD